MGKWFILQRKFLGFWRDVSGGGVHRVLLRKSVERVLSQFGFLGGVFFFSEFSHGWPLLTNRAIRWS